MQDSPPPLTWSLIGTLAWFGLRQRSLTALELSRLALKQTTSVETTRSLLEKDERVTEKDGYYSLTGDKVRYPTPASQRYYRYKWWRLRLARGILRQVPFVRMVGVLQTVADRTATEQSDIDVLIIIKHGRLYLSRMFITLLLHIAGLRRHGDKVTDRVCLSWFATTGNLDMESVTFPPYDILLAFLFAEMVPVLDSDDTYAEFVAANGWISKLLPNYGAQDVPIPKPSRFARLGERALGDRFGDQLETRLKNWQQARISRNPTNPDPDVQIIATDEMLKFHEKERRRVDREFWEARMRELGENPELITR